MTFTQSDIAEWFGEVASYGGTGTQMGDGIFGSQPGAASIRDMRFYNTTGHGAFKASVTLAETDPTCYNYGSISQDAYRLGGPGC